MKLGIVVASENALPSAFAVFRGIEKSAEIIHRLGYDGMELALKESDEITHDELRAILKKNSLEVSAISTGRYLQPVVLCLQIVTRKEGLNSGRALLAL